MARLANAVAAACALAGVAFAPAAASAKTLADLLTADPNGTPYTFDTLVAALSAAGLVDTFADPTAGPFTVFAPTDTAFANALKMLGITAEEILSDVPTLTTILTNHVVEGVVLAEDLSDGLIATSLAGFPLEFTLNSEGAFVNDIEILLTDLEARNGVAHVIDGVLLPPAEPVSPTRAPSPVRPSARPTRPSARPTDAPVAPMPDTDSPTNRPTDSPTKSPTVPICPPCTCSPTNAPTEAPVAPKPNTDSPVEPPTKAPVEPPTKAPVAPKPNTDSPVEAPTKAPVAPATPTKAPKATPTDAPVRPSPTRRY